MQIFLNISILPSAFFDVRVPVHACMMTGEMQISLGLTFFQFAFALLLPSSHTHLGLILKVLLDLTHAEKTSAKMI